MSFEILSSSLMAPYFGGSIYVWGSIISSFMVSMSVGYFLGGYISKKVGRLSVLIWILMLGSIGIMVIPIIHRPLCELLSDLIMDIRLGSLTAMMILSLPVICLAMVSPYIIGALAKYNSGVGFTAGLVLLISTFGSFLGTNITAFYLIDLFPVSRIIIGLGITGLFSCVILLPLNLDRRMSITLNNGNS